MLPRVGCGRGVSFILNLYIFFSLFVETNHAESKYLKHKESGAEVCEKLSDGTTTCTTADVNLFRLAGVQVGHVEDLKIVKGRTLRMKTLSLRPLIFEIPNFLTEDESQHVIDLALKAGLKHSETRYDPRDSKGLELMDWNRDKRLSLSEMILTIENSFDIYLEEKDVLEMYKDLKLDDNKDTFITQKELGKSSPVQLMEYLREYIKTHPVKKSRHSKQAWLYPDSNKDKVFKNIQTRVQKLTKLPMLFIKKSDFQVVYYGVEGHYNAHHDSSQYQEDLPCCVKKDYSKKNPRCRICRWMTILFYLNNVEAGGGTAFPLAGNRTYDEHIFRRTHKANLQRSNCGEANLVVKPEMGKAVMWYNHLDQEGWVGPLDEHTWHGGCPVIKGHKWIANFWVKFTDDKTDFLKGE